MRLGIAVSVVALVMIGCSNHEEPKQSETLKTMFAPSQQKEVEPAEVYTHFWSNVYPGITVYFVNTSNQYAPIFKVESVDQYPLITVAYPNGSIEQKDRRAFQSDRYVVLTEEVKKLAASY